MVEEDSDEEDEEDKDEYEIGEERKGASTGSRE